MYAIIRHTESTLFPLVASTTTHFPRACATFVLNDVLSSTRLKPFCSGPIVFTPMDPDTAPDSRGGCSGHDRVLAPGSPAARKRKPRRLREEGGVGVAIMISDTRGLWHADMIRSAAARPRGAKSATGVLGLVLTRLRLASTDAGRNEAPTPVASCYSATLSARNVARSRIQLLALALRLDSANTRSVALSSLERSQ